MNRSQFLEQRGKFCQGDLVGAIGEGFGGVFVGFDKNAIAACGHCRPRKNRGKNAIPGSLVSCAAGALNGVCRVKHDEVTAFTQPIQRSHVGDKVIVTKCDASLGKEKFIAAEVFELFGDVFHVPRGEELTFLDVDDAAGLGGSFEEVGLAAEKGGDLKDVDIFPGDFGFLGRVDVGGHRHPEVSSDGGEELTAVTSGHAPEGVDGGAVGLVVGGFEDELDARIITDGFEFFSHPAHERFGLDDARAEDKEGFTSTQGELAYFEGVCRHDLGFGGGFLGFHVGNLQVGKGFIEGGFLFRVQVTLGFDSDGGELVYQETRHGKVGLWLARLWVWNEPKTKCGVLSVHLHKLEKTQRRFAGNGGGLDFSH